MDPHLANGGHSGKWRGPVRVHEQVLPPKPRPRLAGTAHVAGWPSQARAIRAVVQAAAPRAPARAPKGGADAAAMEIIENLDSLDARGLYLLRFVFGVIVKMGH